VFTQALARRGVHGCLGGPLAIEASLGLTSGADTKEPTESEPPVGRLTTGRASDGVRDRGRGEDLVDGGTGITPVVDERHASRILAVGYRRRGHGTRMRPPDRAQVSQLGTRHIE